MTAQEIIDLVSTHSERLREDLLKCTTREDHIRITARANEADNILNGLRSIFNYDSDNNEG